MAERKIQISWANLKEILSNKGPALKEEENREITLVKPKEIIIYLRRPS